MTSDIQKAIDIVNSSRETHIEWRDYIKDYPEEASKPTPQVEIAGSIEFHSKCIEDYDFVIKVLESMASK